jgi:hypothetical protein
LNAVTDIQAAIMLEDPSLDASEAFELARLAVSKASDPPKWEYKRLEYEPNDDQLTSLGADGWELCSFQQLQGFQLYRRWVWVFKRPIRSANELGSASATRTQNRSGRPVGGTSSVAPEASFTITQPWSTGSPN